jgi:hypothetical protein
MGQVLMPFCTTATTLLPRTRGCRPLARPGRFARRAYGSLARSWRWRPPRSSFFRSLAARSSEGFAGLRQGPFYRSLLECTFRNRPGASNSLPNRLPLGRGFPRESTGYSANDCANRASYAANCRTSYGASCLLRNRRNLDVFR